MMQTKDMLFDKFISYNDCVNNIKDDTAKTTINDAWRKPWLLRMTVRIAMNIHQKCNKL
jgi:hypothetical protein